MATEIATAYVQIIPSAQGIKGNLEKEFGGAADTAATKAGKSSGKTFASAIGKGFLTSMAVVATAAYGIVSGVVKGTKAVADYGDEIDKTSQKLGFTAQAYQEWDYVLQLNGSSMSSVSAGLKTLTNKLDDARNGSVEAQSMFNALGLSLEDISDMSAEDLFGAVITGFQNMEDSTERAALANDIFGRSGQELAPLFNNTAEATQEAINKANLYGMVMSQDLVDASAAFVDSQTTLSGVLQGLKNRLLGEFLPALTEVTDGLAAFLSGDTSGLEDIQEGISDFITQLSEELPKVLEFGVGVIEAIATGILENAPALLQTATDTVMSLATFLLQNLPQILQVGIDLIIQLANGITQALPTLIPTIVQVVMQLVQIIIENLPTIIEAGLDIVIALVQGIIAALPILIENLPTLIQTIFDTLVASIDVIMEAGLQLLNGIVEAIPEFIPVLIENLPTIIDTIINGVIESVDALIEASIILWTAIAEAIPEFLPQLIAALPQILMTIVNALLQNIPTLLNAAVQMFTAIITAIPQIVISLIAALPQIIRTIIQSLRESGPQILQTTGEALMNIVRSIPPIASQLFSSMVSVGKNLITGLWNGISNMVGWIYSKISGFASSVLSYIKGLFGISSPSKETAYMGKMLDYGLAGGIEDNMNPIKGAIDEVTDLTTGTLQDNLAVNASLGVSTDAQATSKLDQLIATVAALGSKMENMQIVIDSGALVGATSTKYNQALGFDQALVSRGVAR